MRVSVWDKHSSCLWDGMGIGISAYLSIFCLHLTFNMQQICRAAHNVCLIIGNACSIFYLNVGIVLVEETRAPPHLAFCFQHSQPDFSGSSQPGGTGSFSMNIGREVIGLFCSFCIFMLWTTLRYSDDGHKKWNINISNSFKSNLGLWPWLIVIQVFVHLHLSVHIQNFVSENIWTSQPN